MKKTEVIRHQERVAYLVFRATVLNSTRNNLGIYIDEEGQHYKIIEPENTTGFDPNMTVTHVTKELSDARLKYFHEVQCKTRLVPIGFPNVTEEMINERIKKLPTAADFSKDMPWAGDCKTVGIPD